MNNLIYIVDDEKKILDIEKTFLVNNGFIVETFESPKALLKKIESKIPDLFIIDIMMPEMDGLTLLTHIRALTDAPVLIVSAKDKPEDRVMGLMTGSSDYLIKPFLPLELVFRVQKILGVNEEKEEEALSVGNLTLSEKEHSVFVKNKKVKISPNEFTFLKIVMAKENEAIKKEELLKKVYGYEETEFNQRLLLDLIKRLRKKLTDAKANVVIETVWGYGFKICSK